MVRLFVGGLAEDVTSEQLAQRFQFFGRVSSCDVLQPKANDTNTPPTSSCRGFGYVQLEIEDDATLRKCLTAVSSLHFSVVSVTMWQSVRTELCLLLQYNGSKWRGKVLRVQPAKPDYLSRLHTEWSKEQEEVPKASATAAVTELEHSAQANPQPLTLTTPAGKVALLSNSLHPFDRHPSCTDPAVMCLLILQMMETKPLKRKAFFPVVKAKALGQLSWEGLPPTAGILRKQAFAVQMQRQPEVVTASKRTKTANEKVTSASQTKLCTFHVLLEGCCIACVWFMQAAGKASLSESSSESLGAVEFLDDDSKHAALKVLTSIKKFTSALRCLAHSGLMMSV